MKYQDVPYEWKISFRTLAQPIAVTSSTANELKSMRKFHQNVPFDVAEFLPEGF